MDHDEQLLLHRGAHGDAQQGALHPGCRTTSTDSPGKQSACTCAARLSAGSSPEGPSTRSQTRRGTAAPCLPEEPERNRSTCLTNNDIYAPTVRPNRQVSLLSTTTVEKGPSEERGLPGFLATLSRYVLRPRPHTDRSGLPPPSPQPPPGDGGGGSGATGSRGTPPSVRAGLEPSPRRHRPAWGLCRQADRSRHFCRSSSAHLSATQPHRPVSSARTTSFCLAMLRPRVFLRPPSLAYLRVAMQRLRRLGARCSSLLERRAPGGVRCLVLGRCRCVS